MTLLDDLGTRVLRRLDPETAHRLTVKALAAGLGPRGASGTSRLAVAVAGLEFANPIGVAAGFDKDAEAFPALLRMGFGHVEVGTLTPRPQPGNPAPRVFRLVEDRAVINRYGFNNGGFEPAHRRLVEARTRGLGGVVGVNVGANKDSEDRVADYVAGIRRFADVASYLTVNVSSPNTPGLRSLQARDALAGLLDAVLGERDRAAERRPVFLKIAPDLEPHEIEDVVETALNAGVDGLVVSNTTIGREGLRSPKAAEAGGLSGAPLFERSTDVLRTVRRHAGPDLPIIGVGGVGSIEQVEGKLKAGANLVQLYTALVYEGPSLARRLIRALEKAAREEPVD